LEFFNGALAALAVHAHWRSRQALAQRLNLAAKQRAFASPMWLRPRRRGIISNGVKRNEITQMDYRYHHYSRGYISHRLWIHAKTRIR
jgi:hypothetical protein